MGKLGRFHVYSGNVIVDPPIVVGAWSMAFLLRQYVDYSSSSYYYYYYYYYYL